MTDVKSFDELISQLEVQTVTISPELEKKFNDYMRDAIRISQRNRYQAVKSASSVVLTR